MAALDIAPSLHFVEPVLKINGKEWIKMMDECVHCAHLRNPSGAWALSFYCSWTTRRRTLASCRLVTTERGQAAVGCSRNSSAQRHSEKRHPRAFDFPWHSPQTHTAPQAQTAHSKMGPLTLKNAWEPIFDFSVTRHWAPRPFFMTVPQVEETTR